MMPSARRIEVFTGSAVRRKWNAELKAQIVAESYATSVGEVRLRGASVSIEPGANPAMVTAILMALRAAR